MDEKRGLDYMKDILVSLFGGYAITFLGVLMLALFLFLFQITENTVDIGILIIYIMACTITGVIIGKRTKYRKFFWGMLSGISYFLVLFILSKISGQNVENLGKDLVTTFLICVGSGTFGGMLA
mgnify:CR=1 FL=1